MFKKMNLFSKTESRILRFVGTKDGEIYQQQVAKEAGVSAGSAHAILNDFARRGLVKKTGRGRMQFYRRNDGNPLLRQYKIFDTVNTLTPLLEKITPASRRIVLFGSCAEGTNGEKSDVDLMILTGEKEKVRRLLEKYPKVQAILLNSVEWQQLKEKDKPLHERIGRGIVLHGVEND